MERSSFVWYKTFRDAAKAIQDPMVRLAFLEAIMDYGITGEYDKSNDLVNALMQQVSFAIDKANENYDKATESGRKGGARRKFDHQEIRELYADGNTEKEIAEMLGCSTKTVSRVVRERG